MWTNRHGYIWRGPTGTDICLMWTNRHGYTSDVERDTFAKLAPPYVVAPSSSDNISIQPRTCKLSQEKLGAELKLDHEIVAANDVRQQWSNSFCFDSDIQLFPVQLFHDTKPTKSTQSLLRYSYCNIILNIPTCFWSTRHNNQGI